jgi:hypothetical protein
MWNAAQVVAVRGAKATGKNGFCSYYACGNWFDVGNDLRALPA